jgi:hypothetical protein
MKHKLLLLLLELPTEQLTSPEKNKAATAALSVFATTRTNYMSAEAAWQYL